MLTHDSELAMPIEFTLDPQAVRAAIAERFYADHYGRMVVHPVGAHDRVGFYRVNWWRTEHLTGHSFIAQSAFVRVEQTPDGLAVEEITRGATPTALPKLGQAA